MSNTTPEISVKKELLLPSTVHEFYRMTLQTGITGIDSVVQLKKDEEPTYTFGWPTDTPSARAAELIMQSLVQKRMFDCTSIHGDDVATESSMEFIDSQNADLLRFDIEDPALSVVWETGITPQGYNLITVIGGPETPISKNGVDFLIRHTLIEHLKEPVFSQIHAIEYAIWEQFKEPIKTAIKSLPQQT